MDIERAMSTLWFQVSLASLKNMHIRQEHERLSYNSLLYLDLIYFMGGQGTVSRLAGLLKVSKPGVTLKVNGLAEQGYIFKIPSKEDRRVNYLRINENKISEYSLYRSQIQGVAREAGLRFSAADITAFCSIINFITEKYQEN